MSTRAAIRVLCCMLLVASCSHDSSSADEGGGGSGGSGGSAKTNDSVKAVAQQLTVKMEIPDSEQRDGAIPKATAGTVMLMPTMGTVMLSPGGSASILSLDVDNPDEADNPVSATLLQFGGDDDHHIHADGTLDGGTIETSYTVPKDACDGLCAKVYTFTMHQAVELEDESVSDTIERTIQLDCSDDGDADLCGDSDSSGSDGVDPDSLAGRVENSFNALSNELCDCIGGACKPIDSVGVDTKCAALVFASYQTDEPDYLTCINDAVQAYAKCVAGASCSSTQLDTCGTDFVTAGDDCGTAPGSFDDEFTACEDGSGGSGGSGGSSGSGGSGGGCAADEFACDDGTCIPDTWVCDDSDDCLPDGEDEAGC